MNNKIKLIDPLTGQKALVTCLGNEAPCINDIGEYNQNQIIHTIIDKTKQKLIPNIKEVRIAINFIKQLTC